MPRWDGVQETIGEIQALKRQELPEEAKDMLEKVYKYVAPIMRKRHFRVHKLVEFLPKDSNLLGVNVNHGQRISLRLRYNHDSRQFLAFESVLGTMLHELCHNVYGPHDRQFFALLDELTREMEDMIFKGYSGDQFIGIGTGRVLSTRPGSTSQAPYKKPTLTRRSPKSGQRLGGLGGRLPTAPQAIRERALQAAERRREADLRCRAVNRVEDLASDEDGDIIEISPEEFYSPRVTPRGTPDPAPVTNTAQEKAQSIPLSKNGSDALVQTKTQTEVQTPKREPEVIYLLSDED